MRGRDASGSHHSTEGVVDGKRALQPPLVARHTGARMNGPAAERSAEMIAIHTRVVPLAAGAEKQLVQETGHGRHY